jgi:hypothetical protein
MPQMPQAQLQIELVQQAQQMPSRVGAASSIVPEAPDEPPSMPFQEDFHPSNDVSVSTPHDPWKVQYPVGHHLENRLQARPSLFYATSPVIQDNE